jgi:thiol-disulfide isomerase/thioredoxin
LSGYKALQADIQPASFYPFAIVKYICVLLLLFVSPFWLETATNAGEMSRYNAKESDSPTPTFTLKAIDGTSHRLEEYRDKVLLVNFWASWCSPCVTELPSMQRLADRLSTPYFEVLLVNVGESSFRVAKFLRLIDIRLTALLDEEREVFKAWGATVYPTSYVLDGTGRIRYIVRGPLEWDDETVVTTLREMLPTK